MSKFSDATFYLSPSGYKEGFIFPQKPLSSNGDVTFTRAGSAWRTNLEGQIEESPYNLLSYSEDFSNAIWLSGTAGTGVLPTKSYNTILAPNGTLTADTIVFDRGAGNTISDSSVTSQYFTDTALTTYTFSIWVKASTVSDVGKQIFLRIGAAGTLPPTTLTSDWTRISTTQTNTTAGGGAYVQFGNRGTVTSGNSVSVDVWGAQIVRGSLPKNYLATTNRQNFPRIDYSLGTGNLLLEPQRTNSILYSEQFNNVAWLKVNVTVTPDTTIAPDGTITADTIDFTLSDLIEQNIVTTVANQTHTISCWVKTVSGTKTFNLKLTHAGVSNYYSPLFTATTQWQRFTFSQAFGAGGTGFFAGIICGGNTGILNVWGMQVEANSAYATTYIPTTTAAATRIVDKFSRSNLYTNNLISASGGTWFVEFRNNLAYTGDAGGDSICIGDTLSTVGNNFRLYNPPSLGRMEIRKTIASASTLLYTTTTDNVKMTIKWNGSTADVFVNGVKVVSATVFTTTLMENFITNIVASPKYIQQTALWNTPLTDTQCIELTS